MSGDFDHGKCEVHLRHLLKFDNRVRVLLIPNYWTNLFDSARRKVGGWKRLVQHLTEVLGRKVSLSSLIRWRSGKQYSKHQHVLIDAFVPLDVAFAVASIVSRENEIEKYVIGIKGHGRAYCIWSPRFPISILNPHTAAVVGHILHDGYLQEQTLLTVYCNKDPENIAHFVKSVQGMLGTAEIEFGVTKNKDGLTRVACPTIVGRVLLLLELQPGNKVKNDAGAPNALLGCRGGVIRAYLRALATDEANIGPYAIRVKLASRSLVKPSKLLEFDWKLFKKIGIRPRPIHLADERTTKQGDVHSHWQFFICGKENLWAFREKVGFVSRKKRNMLNRILKGYRPGGYIMLREDFRVSMIKSAAKIMKGTRNYRRWLESKLERKISQSTLRAWFKGYSAMPLEAIIATIELLNYKTLGYGFNDIYSNIIYWKANHKSVKIRSGGRLTSALKTLGFEIL